MSSDSDISIVFDSVVCRGGHVVVKNQDSGGCCPVCSASISKGEPVRNQNIILS